MINKLLQQQFRLSNMLLHLFTISNENPLQSAADLFIETDTDTDTDNSLSLPLPTDACCRYRYRFISSSKYNWHVCIYVCLSVCTHVTHTWIRFVYLSKRNAKQFSKTNQKKKKLELFFFRQTGTVSSRLGKRMSAIFPGQRHRHKLHLKAKVLNVDTSSCGLWRR